MYFYKLILSYKGTRYSGWQNQTPNPETIQNHVETVLRAFVNFQEIKVIGASRTDTGVHASGQVLKIGLPKEIDPTHLVMGLNSKLPNDIRALEAEFISEKFNVNRDCQWKEYHYYFCANKKLNAVLSEMVLDVNSDLNIEEMKKAIHLLQGENNFLSFCTMGQRITSPNRNILECSLEMTSFAPMQTDIYFLKIKSSGFLKYMVRFIMGALINIGKGNLSLVDFERSLSTGVTYGARMKAPPHGLHLMQINYGELSE